MSENKTPSWHEQDSFWETFQSSMFTPMRWQQASEEVERIEALLEVAPGAAFLDLSCGPGRHTLELARRGYPVTGVDRTARYLQQARQKAAAEGLDVEFVQADAREFCRSNAFDYALSMYTSFGYFDDPAENQRMLENVAQSLKPGGKLALEIMGKEILARTFRERDWYEDEDGTLHLEERRIDDGWERVSNRWIVVKDGERKEYAVSHWIYSAAELTGMLRQAGFSQARAYGSLEGVPYNQDAARLVVVGVR